MVSNLPVKSIVTFGRTKELLANSKKLSLANSKNRGDNQNGRITLLAQTAYYSNSFPNRHMTSFPTDLSRVGVEQQFGLEILNETTSVARNLNSGDQIQVIDVNQLTGEIALAWNRFREDQPQKESPYFAMEFTQAVAAIRDDVQIAVFRDADGAIEALLPFQKTSAAYLEPIGGRLNDVHGILGGRNLSADQILNGLATIGIRAASFHAAADYPWNRRSFSVSRIADSPLGFVRWLGRLLQVGKKEQLDHQTTRAKISSNG